MKLIKLTSLALAAAGIFGVYNAGAAPIGVTTNNTPLNVAITVVTNAPNTTSGNTTTWKTQTIKINNKTLITVFSHWSTNAFAVTGAKLVIGWDQQWNGDVLVVDKTGTNVLFDASSGNAFAADFLVDFVDEYGAFTETDNNSTGAFNYTDFNQGDYELVDHGVWLPFTDISGVGSSQATYSQKAKNKVPAGWNLSAMGMFPLVGNQSFLNGAGKGSASASIKSSGSGKGSNNFWY
jgi:hypothetical protein